MFQTLLASNPQAPPGPTRFLASLGLHGLALLAALAFTTKRPAAPISPREAGMRFLLPPLHHSQPRPATRTASESPLFDPVPVLPVIDPPTLPTPDIGSSSPTVAELLASGSGTGGSPVIANGSPSGVAARLSAELRDELEVDQPVEIVEQPSLRYPPALAQAGVVGRVELEYVVDTLGRVEPGSVRTLASTQPEFEAVARRAVLASRFRPAEWRGQLVRQRARQSFRFRSTSGGSSAHGE
jgi:TonB family protein